MTYPNANRSAITDNWLLVVKAIIIIDLDSFHTSEFDEGNHWPDSRIFYCI